MHWLTRRRGLWITAVGGLLAVGLGLYAYQTGPMAAGTIALGFALGRLRWLFPASLNARVAIPPRPALCGVESPPPRRESTARPGGNGEGLSGVVGRLMAQDRFALAMRPRIAAMLSTTHLMETAAALEESMSLVPEGHVRLFGPPSPHGDERASTNGASIHGTSTHGSEKSPPASGVGERVWVDAVFLDRFTVTNRQFAQFVSAGGYEQMELWEQEIWIAVLDFVDLTGLPGPRYWRDGNHAEGEEDLPVVGVCWYEAAAYARWAGRRLPSEAEWAKGASWPVDAPNGGLLARRYPWGDSLGENRANLWGSGQGRAVAAHWYTAGQSVGGLRQLVGNVWEWTSSTYAAPLLDDPWASDGLIVPGEATSQPLKVLRGGAFDTYFEEQATCNFRSGDRPTTRKPNVGFRLALSACDVADALDRVALETSAAAAEGTHHESTGCR